MKRNNIILLFILLLPALSCFAESKDFFQKARPVWAAGAQLEKNLTIGLHKVVDIQNFEDAVFSITASSCYKFYVNGAFIGFGPSITAHDYFRVDRYDLSEKLKPGINVLAVVVAGYNVDNYYIPNQSSFVQAELVVDGEVLTITASSGEENTFALVASGQKTVDISKYSYQRVFMEEYRLNPGYNAWMTETAPDFKIHTGRRSHGRWKAPEGIDFVKIRVEETEKKNLLPRGVKYPDYSFRSYSNEVDRDIYEFDKIYTGFIVCELQVKKATKLSLVFDEILIDGDIDPKRMGVEPYVRYDLEPGNYILESFEPYGLKYLKAIIEKGECEIKELKIRQYANSDVSQAYFHTSNANINMIFEAARETFRQNALDVFMDCPSRERAGWLCDSYFTARVAHYLSGNTLVEENFLENFLLPERFENIPEGMLPMCYPADHTNGNFIPNWAMWFVLQLGEYIERSGDYETLLALRPRVMALMDYFERFQNEDGLLEKLEKWVFVEWSAANGFVQDVNYPTNMLYAKTLELAGRLYKMPVYSAQAEKIRKTIRMQAMNGIFFVDHSVRENGKLELQRQNMTEVCQYYAFYFDVANPEDDPELFKFLIEELSLGNKEALKKVGLHPCNAFIGNYLRMEILSRYHWYKALLSEIEEGFLTMAITTGTLWEHTKPTASCNHGFASHAGYVLLRDFGGIRRIDQVNRSIDILFTDNDLENCEVRLPVGNDVLGLKWEKKGSKIYYDLKTPPNYKIRIDNSSGLLLEEL